MNFLSNSKAIIEWVFIKKKGGGEVGGGKEVAPCTAVRSARLSSSLSLSYARQAFSGTCRGCYTLVTTTYYGKIM